MKRLLLLVAVLLPFLVEAQYIAIGANNSDTTTERYVQFSPTNTQGNRRVIEKIKDSTFWSLRTARAFIRALDSTKASINGANNLLWVSSFGELRRADISSILLDTSTLYASKSWVQDRGYITSVAGSLGYIPVPSTRSLTINGITQDLSTNRTWSVGDILSTSSYSNPSWITSLAWSKITGTPTTMAGYGISDGVTSATLSGMLSSYVSNSSLSSTLAGYATASSVVPSARSAISLTTTGTSGASTYNSTTGVLNIPQYTGTTYTAGTGIGIAGNVISNSAPDQVVSIASGAGISTSGTYPSFTVTNTSPDQVVSLTAGRGISITGTYPNFTISLVTPTINIVTRSLNTNFTPSATKETYVSYSVTCSVTNPLLVGTSTAMAYLEYSTNGGSSWLLPAQNGNSSGVGITVTLQLTNGQTGTLVGFIPANALVRIRTATTGTATVTYTTGTEMNY